MNTTKRIVGNYELTYDENSAVIAVDPLPFSAPAQPSALDAAKAYSNARLHEPSTWAGAGIGAMTLSTLSDSLSVIATNLASGDYVGAVARAIPLLIAGAASGASIVHVES
jgi:hypothetical protein